MGVPYLFKWLTNKYSDIMGFDSELNVDNLYFDLNGLIHPCCHPEDGEQPKNEEQMYENIIKYIEKIIDLVKPKKLIYVAIDGVAPFAKINQQRMRRFKSSQLQDKINEIKSDLNMEITPAWDSNAITPGTEFLYGISQKLKNYFSTYKQIKIIYSDCNVPGEGEHKFISYIRNIKNNHLTHVIYGLDADLIMLSLLLNKRNIYLIREKIIHRKDLKKKETEFNYLYLDMLKKYLLVDFSGFSFNNVINDFVFLSFLLGNDFLPNIPHLKIKNNGLDYILKNYKYLLKKFNNRYIIENNNFNMKFLQLLFHNLSKIEDNPISKKNYIPKNQIKNEYDERLFKLNYVKGLYKDTVKIGEIGWEKRYYEEYFNFNYKNNYQMRNICYNYFKTLKWNYIYYTQGCPSWNWFYPYRNTPCLSDLKQFLKSIDLNKIQFDKSFPIQPIEQLLCVLPPQSSNLLPEKLRKLTHSHDSNILDFYPIDFESDYSGKTFLWECYPKIPFIDIKRIKNEIKIVKFNDIENQINKLNNTPFIIN